MIIAQITFFNIIKTIQMLDEVNMSDQIYSLELGF